jgi:drug/metabolite transporter (DMT)-like permease
MNATASALPTSAARAHPHRREAVLVFITMLWGGTFLAVHNALQWSGPFALVSIRFGLAALMLALFLRGKLLRITAHELRAGALIGTALFFGYSLQCVGLESISSSKSAFLTALYVPMVPLVQWVWLRRAPSPAAWGGIALAFIGTVLLSDPGALDGRFGLGEAFTIAAALAIAFEILLLSRFAHGCDPSRLAFVQMVFVAGTCLLVSLVRGEKVPEPDPVFVITLVGLGAATAFIQFAMNWAQQVVSATRATLIYSLEPVWAGLVGRIAGEQLGPRHAAPPRPNTRPDPPGAAQAVMLRSDATVFSMAAAASAPLRTKCSLK